MSLVNDKVTSAQQLKGRTLETIIVREKNIEGTNTVTQNNLERP
jgi:hypothetical protein